MTNPNESIVKQGQPLNKTAYGSLRLAHGVNIFLRFSLTTVAAI